MKPKKKTNIIDSHVHLDLIESYHPNRIQWLMKHRCGVISWAFVAKAESLAHLEAGLHHHTKCIKELFSIGMECAFLTGVHPRSIPAELRPEQIEDLLMPYLEDNHCLGIGEIGIETGTTLQEEIFIAQLELGRRLKNLGFTIGVHTPRSNKAAITKVTLKILEAFQDMAPRIVVDHCRLETIGDVFASGCWAGVTLSPSKASRDELKAIAAEFPSCLDRIVCNTDSGSAFHEDLIHCFNHDEFPQDIRQKLFMANAVRCFWG